MTFLSFMKRYSLLFLGSIMVLSLLFTALFGEYFSFVDRDLKEIKYIWNDKNIPVAPPFAPSEQFLLGTDSIGRDMVSLLIVSAKETLLLVLLITIIRYTLAIPLAYLAHKKKLGAKSMILWINGFLSYIPTIIIFVLIATLPPLLTIKERPILLMFILAILELGRAADLIKKEFDDLSTKEFIQGGIAVGASPLRLLKSYYLPFLYEKILVNMISDLGRVMFLLGQLGFIGIFLSQDLIQVDPGRFHLINNSITWPTFFMNAFRDIRGPIWIPFFPALAITYSILSFNVFAQGLQKLFKKNVSYF